jgi:hypothetical protein
MLHFTIMHMSAILGFLSIEAVLVAVFRLASLGRHGDGNGNGSEARLPMGNVRAGVLVAFAVYLTGAAIREAVVLIWGLGVWSDEAIIWSAGARVLQIIGACLFVGAATYRQCGHWVWGTVLVAAILSSTVAA